MRHELLSKCLVKLGDVCNFAPPEEQLRAAARWSLDETYPSAKEGGELQGLRSSQVDCTKRGMIGERWYTSGIACSVELVKHQQHSAARVWRRRRIYAGL